MPEASLATMRRTAPRTTSKGTVMSVQKIRNGIGLAGALLAVVAIGLTDRSDNRGIVEMTFPAPAFMESAAARSRILAEAANREAADIASRAIVDGVQKALDKRLEAPNKEIMVASR